ncbi:MAG: hypothetical protein CME70_04285 [Halobacteriovorax sp.]|nr:hypothetical protein [Halobacteriovorax sp.]
MSETLSSQSKKGEDFSLFDLADLLDISYLALSDIYFKRKKPSLESMEYIFSKLSELGLFNGQKQEFNDLVLEVEQSLVVLRNIEDRNQWLAFAVLELKGFGLKEEKIINRLCIPRMRVEMMLTELGRLNLI